MAANKKNLLLLFDRPLEPVFMEKGPNNAKFDVPSSLLSDRYKQSPEIQERFGENAGERIPVRANITIPNLKVPMSLDRKEQFSLFIPRHRRIAAHLIDIFMRLKSIDDLQTVAVYARDRTNPFMYNYSLSVALLHRPDTKDMNLPLFAETFPEKFVDSKIFREAREEATVVPDGQRRPIIIPKDYTSSDLEPEHR